MRRLIHLAICLLVLPACTESDAHLTTVLAGGGVAADGAPTDYTSDASMEGYWMMEQATGADATDGSGNGNTLTAASDGSGPTQSADNQEGTYSADYWDAKYERHYRTDANLSAGFPGKTGVTDSLSVGCWVNVDSNGAKDMVVKYGGSANSYRLFYDSTYFAFALSSNGEAWTTITDDTAITEDGTVWYHVVGVYDNTNDEIEIFVDGSLNVSAVAFSSTMHTGAAEFRLARQGAGLDGHLDEVFVMSRDLSSTEVLEIYTSGLAGGS